MVLPAARTEEHSGCEKYSVRACISLDCTFGGLRRWLQSADAFSAPACCSGESGNTTLHRNKLEAKPQLQQTFGLRQGSYLYQLLGIFVWFWFCGFFTLYEHDVPYSFKTYKKSCCLRFFPILFHCFCPWWVFYSYKDVTIQDGDYSVNNWGEWKYCSTQYWKHDILNFLQGLSIIAS